MEALGGFVIGWQEGHPASKNRVVGCWCGCLSGVRCRQLYDLRINSMTYSYFLFQIISFKKYFYVSLGNNFFYRFFVEAP